MKIHQIQNPYLQIAVKKQGAELTSIRSQTTGIEYLWQADPKIWGRHAPILFPIVGRLKDDRYLLNGKEYQMAQHGFARDREFTLDHQSYNSLHLILEHDEKTLEQFPFRFQLYVGYELVNASLLIHYHVTNLDIIPMFFSIGAHPGFRCPLIEGERYEDYHLKFEKEESLKRFFITEDGLITDNSAQIALQNQTLPLSHTLFNQGALVFKSLQSKKITLKNRKNEHGVSVSSYGFTNLGIWAKPEADFVCIEPWRGYGDIETASGLLEEKEGIVRLNPREKFTVTNKYSFF
ncbi:MAG: aldose 1-epimerase family protein [Pseudomonadota bacterium]